MLRTLSKALKLLPLQVTPRYHIFDSSTNSSVFGENEEEKRIKKIFKAEESFEADLTP